MFLMWNEKSGVLAEFDMTDNQVSLATQMTQQERTLFWERQKKSDDYTALIKKAEGGEMRADAFQEIVSCESDNAFKSCFANQELWSDGPKWDEMRAKVIELGLLLCIIRRDSERQEKAAWQVKSRLTIQLAFAKLHHSVLMQKTRKKRRRPLAARKRRGRNQIRINDGGS